MKYDLSKICYFEHFSTYYLMKAKISKENLLPSYAPIRVTAKKH